MRPRPEVVALSEVRTRASNGTINSGNCLQFAPWRVSRTADVTRVDQKECRRTCEIDSAFWQHDLTEETRSTLAAVANQESADLIHTRALGGTDSGSREPAAELWWAVYQAYAFQFYYHNWKAAMAPLLPNGGGQLVPLGKRETSVLGRVAKSRALTGRALNLSDIEDLEDAGLIAAIDRALQEIHKPQNTPSEAKGSNESQGGNSEGVFVKLSLTSGKNERAVQPCRTAMDVAGVLTDSKLFAAEYDREWPACLEKALKDRCKQCIVLQPWQSQLQKWREWRAFVYRGRLTAITQQAWYECFEQTHDPKHVERVANSISRFCSETLCPRMTKAFCSTAVLDLWVDDLYATHLIELNPWIMSGAGLFHWPDDIHILQSTDEKTTTVLRYVVQ